MVKCAFALLLACPALAGYDPLYTELNVIPRPKLNGDSPT